MSYTQLTQQQRYRIYAPGKGNHGQREIADIIGCHRGTISRELRRNRGMKGYRPRQAHGLAIGGAKTRLDPASTVRFGDKFKRCSGKNGVRNK